MSLEGAIAAHRFGLGARPGEIPAASRDPKRWLLAQVGTPADQPQPFDGETLQSGAALVADLLNYQRERQMARRAGRADDPVKSFFKNRAAIFMKEMQARFAQGFASERPFAERLVWFWSNHFVVSAQNPRAITLVGAYEREAIRPHINATFEDMLLAVVTHPAMLLYLDNAQSVGPDSIGGRFRNKGLNENLGRELMELYTLGVDGGYAQADVLAMAKLLTGWTIDRLGRGESGFAYVPAIHEPGAVTLRGKTYPSGFDGTVAAIKDLARDPATAKHVARKLATHFISDAPSDASCARIEQEFARTHGDLRALAEVVVDDRDAWAAKPGKMRKPVEYITASLRLMGWSRDQNAQKQTQTAMGLARLMGEFPLSAPSPKGWPDTSDAWSGPDALLNRITFAKELGNRMPGGLDAIGVADIGMGPLLRAETRDAMIRAATPGDAIALLVASPEFQRR